ncbi:MAG: hypothetical protein OXL36_18745, partial [Bryobacterales bacterium]|nr:hypothetical protein [Bryobacterales bacterium]
MKRRLWAATNRGGCIHAMKRTSPAAIRIGWADGFTRAIRNARSHTGERLACISHHPTAEARHTAAMTSLRLLAVLNVLF